MMLEGQKERRAFRGLRSEKIPSVDRNRLIKACDKEMNK